MDFKTEIKARMQRLLHKCGYAIVRFDPHYIPKDIPDESASIIRRVQPYTSTSAERVHSLIEGVKYIEKNNIHGDVVECGVWKGGSMMAAALCLLRLDSTSRHLYLFDTFEGMPKPEPVDIDSAGRPAQSVLESIPCNASLEEVRYTMMNLGYPQDKIHFIKGRVEDTIPAQSPPRIALLRLDTDWYQSTRHELIHLYPRLASLGVLLIDDYGHWQGARKAVDDYFSAESRPILLHRIDYTGRVALKTNV